MTARGISALALTVAAGVFRKAPYGLIATLSLLVTYYSVLTGREISFSVGVYLMPLGVTALAWSVYYSFARDRQMAQGLGLMGGAVTVVPIFFQSLPWVSREPWEVALAIAACVITVALSVFARLRLCLLGGAGALILLIVIQVGTWVADRGTGWTTLIGGIVLLVIGIALALQRERIAKYPELWAKLTEDWI